MPKLPQFTAEPGTRTRLALPQLAAPGPNVFGGQAGESLSQFGLKITELHQKVVNQQEDADLNRLAGQYDIAISKQTATIAEQEPNLDKQTGLLTDGSTKIMGDLRKANPNVTDHVWGAMQMHVDRTLPRAIIHVQAEGVRRQGERAVADTRQEINQLTDQASSAATDQDAESLLHTAHTMVDNLERRGLIRPDQKRDLTNDVQDRYWQLMATKHPDKMVAVFASGEVPKGMDEQKLPHYFNLAIDTKSALQWREEQATKARERVIKDRQTQTESTYTAELLKGNTQVVEDFPLLVATRQMDASTARTLREMAVGLGKEQDAKKLVPGLAAQMEASLLVAKFDGRELAPDVQQGMVSALMQGQITKDEFGHLMGKYGDVLAYKQSSDKEGQNKAVTEAHTNLLRDLSTRGPMDKYDPLESSTQAAAEKYYYKRVDQGVDPWQANKEALQIFKPVVADRQKISNSKEAIAAEEAKITASVKSGAITPAAAKVLRGPIEQRKAREIIQQTLDELPKEAEPSWYERMKKKVSGDKPPAGEPARRK